MHSEQHMLNTFYWIHAFKAYCNGEINKNEASVDVVNGHLNRKRKGVEETGHWGLKLSYPHLVAEEN